MSAGRHPLKGIWEEADKLARNNFKRRKGSYRYYYQVTRTSGPMRRSSKPTHGLEWTVVGYKTNTKSEHVHTWANNCGGHRSHTYNPQRNQLYSRWQTIVGPTNVSQGYVNTPYLTLQKKPSHQKEKLSLPTIHWQQNCRISYKARRC